MVLGWVLSNWGPITQMTQLQLGQQMKCFFMVAAASLLPSIFRNLEWRSESEVKTVFVFTKNRLGCSNDPTVKLCPIKLKFYQEVPLLSFFILSGGIAHRSSAEEPEILWTAANRSKFLSAWMLVVSTIQLWKHLRLPWNFY